jgi:hypothetical protein
VIKLTELTVDFGPGSDAVVMFKQDNNIRASLPVTIQWQCRTPFKAITDCSEWNNQIPCRRDSPFPGAGVFNIHNISFIACIFIPKTLANIKYKPSYCCQAFSPAAIRRGMKRQFFSTSG